MKDFAADLTWYEGVQNPFYRPGKVLPAGVGNNAFSLDRLPDREDLAITPLRIGSLDELRVGESVAFQDFDEEDWMACRGLASAILCLDYAIPISVFDNHNHVFYAWCEALKAGWFDPGATLIHMDEHFDAAEPPGPWSVDLNDLADVWRLTNEVLQIATYIKPALELGLFSECIDYVESAHFERNNETQDQVVLNLDIDVFHPDMSHISWEEKISVLKQYLPRTRLITMATSPYFIDQEEAIRLVRRVADELF